MTSLLGNLAKGLSFIISAPAGTGKTTLVKMLTKEMPLVIASISFTTRAPREGEVPGIHYHFISEEAFKDKIKKGDFLEYVQLYGTYYGTSISWVEEKMEKGNHVILVIDTQGALQLKEKFKAVSIFIRPPSMEELKSRLMARQTETMEVIQERLYWARKELLLIPEYDYEIVNDDLAVAYQTLRSILIAECHRVRPIQ